MEQEPGMAKKRGIVTEQSERGPDGVLRAVLDREVTTPQPIIALERVRSVRHGKRRATQLLSAATKNADLTSPPLGVPSGAGRRYTLNRGSSAIPGG
jgi:hypothetical protein